MIKDPDNFSTFLPRCGRADLFNFIDNLANIWREAELKSVVNDYRDVSTLYLNQDYDNQLNRLADFGLIFQPLMRVKSFDGFGHKHEISENIDENTSVYGVISKNVSSLKKFKEFFSEGDDFNVGLMLGYPECCCRSYSDYTRRGIIDPVCEIAESTPLTTSKSQNVLNVDQISWKLQIHLRYFGLKIIPFFPCSFVCDEAISKAEEWHKILRSINSEAINTLESLMKRSSTWSLYNAQIVVNRPPFKADFLGYATSSYFPEKREVEFLNVE